MFYLEAVRGSEESSVGESSGREQGSGAAVQLKCNSERTMLNLICLYNFTSRRPPVSSHSKPDKHTHSGLAVDEADTLVQRRSRGPSFSYLTGGIWEGKKMEVFAFAF